MEVRKRLIILGLSAGAVAVLVVGLYVLDSRVFKSEIDPGLQSHFSRDNENWWKELPINILPTRSGIYNSEGWKNEEEELNELISGKSNFGDLSIVEVSHTKDGFVEIILSRKTSDCGTITGGLGTISDELRLRFWGYADIDDNGVAEQCIFVGRANMSDTCLLGSGNFMSYGDWYVLGKATENSNVKILEVRKTECQTSIF
jgi:hypothetical protein